MICGERCILRFVFSSKRVWLFLLYERWLALGFERVLRLSDLVRILHLSVMNVYIIMFLSVRSIMRDPILKGVLGFKGLSSGL
jgi:hypothetical protein